MSYTDPTGNFRDGNKIDVDFEDRDIDRPLVGEDNDNEGSGTERLSALDSPADSSKDFASYRSGLDLYITYRGIQVSPGSRSVNRGLNSNAMHLAPAIPYIVGALEAAGSWFLALFTTKTVIITTTAGVAAYGAHRGIQNRKRNAVAAGTAIDVARQANNALNNADSNKDTTTDNNNNSTTTDGTNSGETENNGDNSTTKEQRSREKGKRFKDGDDAFEQLEEIERAQSDSRNGKGDVRIDNIEKSEQRARNALKPHNLDLD